MVMSTDRLWRKALESLRSRTGMHWWPVCRSCICICIFVFCICICAGPWQGCGAWQGCTGQCAGCVISRGGHSPNLESTSVECGTTWNQPPPKPNLVRHTAPPATSRSRWPLCASGVIVFVSDLCVCVPRPQETCPKIDFIKNHNHRNMMETIVTSHHS